jgi:uncharacterized repeat protein (TIGR01451 family)
MKKSILLAAFFLFIFLGKSYSQSLLSITPNSGVRGQSLTTTVTGAGFFFTMSSYPNQFGLNDIYLKLNNYYIYPSGWSTLIDDDNVSIPWNIPANAPLGNYTVQWDFGFTTYTIPGGFSIADAFVQGNVFWDSDSSLTQNGSENGMANYKVMLLPDSLVTFSTNSGSYSLPAVAGPKNVKILPGNLWNVTTDSVVAVNVIPPFVTGINFGLKGKNDIYKIDVNITGGTPPRCFLNSSYVISITNTGTITCDGEIFFTMSSNLNFITSSVVPDNITGNTYRWDYTDLQPGELRYIFVTCQQPGPLSTITNSVLANAQNPSGNIVYQDEQLQNHAVLCAYDPNDKTAIPAGVQAQNYTLMSDTLDFVIRFQNTGNDTAFNVTLLDTINAAILDLNSFELIASSHPVVLEQRTNGITKFIFNNILLPDSNVNEPGSHGFVRYRCLTKTGLPNNTVLNNTAHIYFDLNPAIVTNTTLNTLVYQIPVGIAEQDATNLAQVLPNPVTEDAIISFSNIDSDLITIKVYDSAGKLIFAEKTTGQKSIVKREKLRAGMFIYEVTNTTSGVVTAGKFVVQ